jgi:hypothetical protein
MKNIIVTSCSNCPFLDYQDEMVTLDCNAVEEGLSYDEKYEKAYRVNKPFIHNDCPLKKETILVQLKIENS